MGKLKFDLNDMNNSSDEIGAALNQVIREAVEKRMTPVEILTGNASGQFKESGQLKKHVLRFLQRPEIKPLYARIEKDDKNPERIFVHFKFK